MNYYYEIYNTETRENDYYAEYNRYSERFMCFKLLLQSSRVWQEDREFGVKYRKNRNNYDAKVDMDEFLCIKLKAKHTPGPIL